VGNAVGVGFEHERTQQRSAHDAEAALGCGIEMARGPVGEGECLLEWVEMAAIGGGDVGRIRQYRGSGGLTADNGGVDAFAGEWIDEACGVAGKEHAAVRCVGVASHAEMLAGDVSVDVGEVDSELSLDVAGEQVAGD